MRALEESLIYYAANVEMDRATLHFHDLETQQDVRNRLVWLAKINLSAARRLRTGDAFRFANVKRNYWLTVKAATKIRGFIAEVDARIKELS